MLPRLPLGLPPAAPAGIIGRLERAEHVSHE
jgi:hypothetical protein